MNLELTKEAQKQLARLKRGDYKLALKIVKSIYLLRDNPYMKGSLKLTGYEGYRFKVKNYRILYRVDIKNETVTIISVMHRKDAYKNISL